MVWCRVSGTGVIGDSIQCRWRGTISDRIGSRGARKKRSHPTIFVAANAALDNVASLKTVHARRSAQTTHVGAVQPCSHRPMSPPSAPDPLACRSDNEGPAPATPPAGSPPAGRAPRPPREPLQTTRRQAQTTRQSRSYSVPAMQSIGSPLYCAIHFSRGSGRAGTNGEGAG